MHQSLTPPWVAARPCADWLNPRNTAVDDVRALMAPPLDGSMEIYAISTAVNRGVTALVPAAMHSLPGRWLGGGVVQSTDTLAIADDLISAFAKLRKQPGGITSRPKVAPLRLVMAYGLAAHARRSVELGRAAVS